MIVGLNGLDHIFGKGGNDLICGGKADRNETQANYGDVLLGGPGDDLLLAAEPAEGFGDYLWGEAGNDRIVGGPYGDTISPGPGRDRVVGRGAPLMDDTLDYSGSRTGVTIDLAAGVATGEGRDRLRGFSDVVGSPHADVMRGDDGPNRLEGGAGHDRLSGRGGDDSLADGIVWSSIDAPRRYPGDDVLAGGPGDDSLALAGGTDTAEGGDGVDSFMSAGGRLHVISGGPEPGQKLAFFAGPATLDLRTGEGSLGPGTLEVFGIQHLSGSREDDVLTGDGADNTIVGGAGYDDLDGGEGFDTLLHHSLVECFPCDRIPFEPVVVDLAAGTVFRSRRRHGRRVRAGARRPEGRRAAWRGRDRLPVGGRRRRRGPRARGSRQPERGLRGSTSARSSSTRRSANHPEKARTPPEQGFSGFTTRLAKWIRLQRAFLAARVRRHRHEVVADPLHQLVERVGAAAHLRQLLDEQLSHQQGPSSPHAIVE